jgi:CRP-like cAMP-binding protein
MAYKNTLLTKLNHSELDIVASALEPVKFSFQQILHEAFEPIEDVYFVEEGVGSLVNETDSGEIVEVATIGAEGMVGFPILLGARSVPSRCLVQIPGAGLRMKAADFERALERAPRLRTLLLRYVMALLNQIAQGTSCNRMHEVQERCARWLLQTHDRVEGDRFPLTQEFLSQMLGVHRPTVSVAAGMLQQAGLIRYTRGQITILDRAGLEAASCSCYRTIKDEYDRLLNGAEAPESER